MGGIFSSILSLFSTETTSVGETRSTVSLNEELHYPTYESYIFAQRLAQRESFRQRLYTFRLRQREPDIRSSVKPVSYENNARAETISQIRSRSSTSSDNSNTRNKLTDIFYEFTMNQCKIECKWMSFSNEIQFTELFEGQEEYYRIKNNFTRFLKLENPIVIKIEKVKNYALMGQYMLKKEEYRCKNINFIEKFCYHGTKRINLLNICRDNFNWRITNRNKFGKGVSFASKSSYANYYCDKRPNDIKIMFVAKVLLGKLCVGFENMPLPQKGFDASMKPDGKVIVKFYDNEYYPEYLIHFTANIIHHQNNNYRRYLR